MSITFTALPGEPITLTTINGTAEINELLHVICESQAEAVSQSRPVYLLIDTLQMSMSYTELVLRTNRASAICATGTHSTPVIPVLIGEGTVAMLAADALATGAGVIMPAFNTVTQALRFVRELISTATTAAR